MVAQLSSKEQTRFESYGRAQNSHKGVIIIKKFIAILIVLTMMIPTAIYAGPPDYNIKFPSMYETKPRFDQNKYTHEVIFRGTLNGTDYKTYYLVSSGDARLEMENQGLFKWGGYSNGLLYELVQYFQNGQFVSQYWTDVSTQMYNGTYILNTLSTSPTLIKWANHNINKYYFDSYWRTQEIYNVSQNPAEGDGGYFIKFLLPGKDGATDHQSRFAFWTYYKIPFSSTDSTANIEITVKGGAGSYGSEILMNKTVKGDGYLEGYFNFSRLVNLGDNEITVEVKAPNGTVVSAKRKVIYKEFVDQNNDGIDDTTGHTAPIPERPDPSTNDPDGTILGYLEWAFDMIVAIFNGLIDIITSLFLNTGKLASIMENFMGFLPWQIRNILILSVTVTVILKIFKR